MMQPTDHAIDVEDLVFEASQQDPPEWRAAIVAGVAQLMNVWSSEPTASVAYAIGYALFHMPGHEEPDFVEAESWLLRALTMEPTNMYATYYLGCLYFEYDRPNQAITYLSQIPKNWFSQFDQEWRDLKRREILLSCRMILDEAIDAQEIAEIIQVHRADPADEVWPLPEELVSTTIHLLTGAPNSLRIQQVADALIAELERAGLAELYAREISTFRGLRHRRAT